jgi:hypothetical protein
MTILGLFEVRDFMLGMRLITQYIAMWIWPSYTLPYHIRTLFVMQYGKGRWETQPQEAATSGPNYIAARSNRHYNLMGYNSARIVRHIRDLGQDWYSSSDRLSTASYILVRPLLMPCTPSLVWTIVACRGSDLLVASFVVGIEFMASVKPERRSCPRSLL